MVPTLYGRIQTRVALLVILGGPWAIVITFILTNGRSPIRSYGTSLLVLLYVLLAGIIWELIYHLLQQFRWEKDWPTLFGLLTGIPEGFALWEMISRHLAPGVVSVNPVAFAWQFLTTWTMVWLVSNGPIKVVSIRWRFRGGRFW